MKAILALGSRCLAGFLFSFAIAVTGESRVDDSYQSSVAAQQTPPAHSSGKSHAGEAIYQWSDSAGKTHFGDRPPKAARDIQRLDVPATNSVPPPPVHPHAETPLNPAPEVVAAPKLTAVQQRRADCNARLKQADDYEKSDQGRLAREIYPWIVANCPENRTGRIGGRIRLVPAPEPGPP